MHVTAFVKLLTNLLAHGSQDLSILRITAVFVSYYAFCYITVVYASIGLTVYTNQSHYIILF